MLGRRETPNGEEWAVASEDCAFGPIGFKRVRDVLPGEMIVIDPEGKLYSKQCAEGKVRAPLALCAFRTLIYLDSSL